MQSAVQEEDRTKNLMIFGLPDEPDEDLNKVVAQVFEAIGDKPRVDVCRLGVKKSNKTARPIKVTTSSTAVVNQVLSNARKLKLIQKYKSVFIRPDRSPEQRTQQRELINDLKKLIKDEPKKRHFIKNGKICSVDK